MDYCTLYTGLKALVRMALAPRFTLGGLQISLDAYSDSNNSAVEKPGQRIITENAKEFLY